MGALACAQGKLLDVFRLHTGNPQLIEFIRATIERDGPVTFEWFMEQALYHPEHGYYSSGRVRIGRRGDYFTNVSVGPIFGELLARQFREMWETLGRPEPFTIVEQGAHHGDFAADVLQFISNRMPDFGAALRYCIVEPFPALREMQAEKLGDRVTWCARVDELAPFCGVHFSNELLDAMPVHLVRQTTAGWRERYVALGEKEFVFRDGELSSDELRSAVASLAASLETARPRAVIGDRWRASHLHASHATEINLRVGDCIGVVARKLTRGYVLAVDYGHPRSEYYATHRSSGTLRCYVQHRVSESPFSHVGAADITAHVEWTSVAEHALASGLHVAGFTDQHHFLAGIVSTAKAADLAQLNRNQLQTLLQPALLGRTFQFLAFSRAAPRTLSGFKFARDPQIALGLRVIS